MTLHGAAKAGPISLVEAFVQFFEDPTAVMTLSASVAPKDNRMSPIIMGQSSTFIHTIPLAEWLGGVETFDQDPGKLAGLLAVLDNEKTSKSEIWPLCLAASGRDEASLGDGAEICRAILAGLDAKAVVSTLGLADTSSEKELAVQLFEKAEEARDNGDADPAMLANVLLFLAGYNPNVALYNLAICLVETGQADDALVLFTQCLEAGLDQPRVTLMLGYCNFRLSRMAGAKIWLSKTARVARRDPAFTEELRGAQRILLAMQFE